MATWTPCRFQLISMKFYQSALTLDSNYDIRVTSGINSEFGFKLVERGGQDLRVFVLNSSGRISVWDERRGGQALFNCIFNVSREVSVADIAVSGKTGNLLIIAKDGTGFEGLHQVSVSVQSRKCII